MVSTMPVAPAGQSWSKARIKRSARIAALAAVALLFVLPFVLPGSAKAAGPVLTRFDQSDGHIDYVGTWDTFERTQAYKTAYARANTKGTAAIIYFEGTRLDWVAMKGSSTGKADVYLDGVFKKTVNLAAPSAVYQVSVYSTGTIPAGRHNLKISRSASSPAGTFITLDAVDVVGSLVYGPPTVTGLSPVSGSIDGGATVAITGSDFNDASAVSFGDKSAASFTVESSTLITAVAPSHAAGKVNVKVTTPAGSTPDTSADDFLFAEVTPPAITRLSPERGNSGSSVVITGTGFIGLTGSDAVTFGGVNATSYRVDSPSQIAAVAPEHAAGTVQVKVKADGGTTTTPAGGFTYVVRYDQADSRFAYSGTWETFSTLSAWKGGYGRTNASNGSVSLTFIGTRLSWMATKGKTAGIADVYVDGVLKATVNLAAPSAQYRQPVWNSGDLADGLHTVKLVRDASSPATTFLTVDAIDIAGTLLGSGRSEQADSRLAYAGTWSTVASAKASGGGYKRASGSGAALYVDFTGARCSWIATTGPDMGKAWVSVDGGAAQSVDLSASVTGYRQKVWTSGTLAVGDHEVKIWRDDSSPAGTSLSVDAFDLVGVLRQAYLWHRYEQSDVRLLYTGSWSTVTASGASSGSYRQTSSSPAYFDFLFSGTQCDWIATTGPGMGKASVSVDGGKPTTVDLSGPSLRYKQRVWTSPTLPDGLHRVQISLGRASINIDAVEVRGSLPSASSNSVAKTMWVKQRLKELSYLPGVVNGSYDYKARGAVIAFQKWERLTRDGAVGPAVWARLHTASRPTPTRSGTTDPWIEVNKTKQVLLFCKNGAVLYTIHVSTGSANVGMITPSGTFSIISKRGPDGHLYYPMAITSGIAIHGYTTVPTVAASHGCVRTQYWDQDVLYPITPLGTRVYIYN